MSKENLIIDCPHCHTFVIIDQLNCRIFRHGYLKSTNEQINPHLSKIECDNLINNNLIYGCGKPFLINNENEAKICDYI